MPIVSLPYKYLERLVGRSHEDVIERLPMIGSDIERVLPDHCDIEFFPSRPDLYSVEGVARAMRGILGIEEGLPEYPVTPSGIGFSVDPGLAEIRPFLGSAVIRGVKFDEESIVTLMGLQESLHWVLGRGRAKVAIGVHDLTHIRPPFRYLAAPRDRSFVPLDFDTGMTLDRILADHPKGRAYAKIVERFDRMPLIEDSLGQVLSFPPIINGELTRVTERTTDLLLDVTGTDRRAVDLTVAIICSAMAEGGARIESVDIDGTPVPTLTPSERVVSVSACEKLLGIPLNADSMAGLLRKMRFGAIPGGDGTVMVQVPCFRADIMHDWDIFEDVAIAYGYRNFEAEIPATFTVGQEHPASRIGRLARETAVGLQYLEVMPFSLTNERTMYGMMQREAAPGVLHLLHPISEDHTIVRTDLVPLLIGTLALNRHREFPQRIFACGDVVLDLSTYQKVGAVSTHPGADFSEIYAFADAFCREMGVTYRAVPSDDPAFIEGRRADLVVGGRRAGVFGEVHPAVLNAFGLEQPVAAFECDLTVVPGYPRDPATP